MERILTIWGLFGFVWKKDRREALGLRMLVILVKEWTTEVKVRQRL